MNTGLVTKLKGSVQNDNLPKFAELTLVISATEDFTLFGKEGSTVTCDAEHTFYQGGINVGSTLTFPILSRVNPRKTDGSTAQEPVTLKITNKYDFTWFRGNSLTSQDYDISNLRYCEKLNNLFIYGPSYKGSILTFAKMIKLNTLQIPSTNITGTISELAAAQVANGRTSGTMSTQHKGSSNTVRFGSDMVEPTEAEIAQGYQIV